MTYFVDGVSMTYFGVEIDPRRLQAALAAAGVPETYRLYGLVTKLCTAAGFVPGAEGARALLALSDDELAAVAARVAADLA